MNHHLCYYCKTFITAKGLLVAINSLIAVNFVTIVTRVY